MCSVCGFSCVDKTVAAQAENSANQEEASQGRPRVCPLLSGSVFFFFPLLVIVEEQRAFRFLTPDVTWCSPDSKAKLRVVSDARKARMPFFFCFPWELSLRDETSARKTWTSDGMT